MAEQITERNEQDQQVIIAAVKRWLTQESKWLLIFDNVEDIQLISHFLSARSHANAL